MKYRQRIEDAGGHFVPLVVEAFGRWSPYAREMLGIIAARGTVFSGVEGGTALRNLLQQLSVVLWTYNSKMLTNVLASLPSGPDWLCHH